MKNRIVAEFNDRGYLLYSDSFPGAFTRGESMGEALGKFHSELQSYCLWSGQCFDGTVENTVVQEKESMLKIEDADSDVIFDSEKECLTAEEYGRLRSLVLKSANDFEQLYSSIPDKDTTSLPPRETFYGPVPRTAHEMYQHTNSVTSYYTGEIEVVVENVDSIVEGRILALDAIESESDYLKNDVFQGSYEEYWSLRKVLRRFVWHDRIHAKAMYRMAIKLWRADEIANPFYFAE